MTGTGPIEKEVPVGAATGGWTRDTMTPRERFLGALLGQPVDRVPVGTLTQVITVESQDESGAYLPEAHFDPEAGAVLAATAHEILGFDSISPAHHGLVEAHALGCEVDWGDKQQFPTNTTSPYQEPDQITIPPDFMDRPTVKHLREMIQLLVRRYGGRVAIVGKVAGPWTLSYHLKGVQDFLIDIILNPQRVRGFLDLLKEVTVRHAVAQREAGADVIHLFDHATGDLVSAETYREFLLPVHKQMVRRIGGPIYLHCCGRTQDRMALFAEAGFTAYHFESRNDAVEAKRLVGERMRLMGNVNTPQLLLSGTPEEVKREARKAIEAGVDILAPECAVPAATPNRNLAALVEASKEYGRRS